LQTGPKVQGSEPGRKKRLKKEILRTPKARDARNGRGTHSRDRSEKINNKPRERVRTQERDDDRKAISPARVEALKGINLSKENGGNMDLPCRRMVGGSPGKGGKDQATDGKESLRY